MTCSLCFSWNTMIIPHSKTVQAAVWMHTASKEKACTVWPSLNQGKSKGATTRFRTDSQVELIKLFQRQTENLSPCQSKINFNPFHCTIQETLPVSSTLLAWQPLLYQVACQHFSQKQSPDLACQRGSALKLKGCIGFFGEMMLTF